MDGEAQDTTVLVERRGALALVTLNRPETLNASDRQLHTAVTEVWGRLAAEPDLRAVVVTGAGRAFSAGGDLGLLDNMVHDLGVRRALIDEGRQLVTSFASLRVPVVAAVNGPAVGLGCSLASLCDLVVIEEHAYFMDPHVKLGLVAADGGALTWPLVLGLHQAKELLFLGGRVSADDALRLGLANRVVPKGTSVEVAIDLAEQLAALPPQAVQETKAILNGPLLLRIEQQLEAALEGEYRSFDTAELQANLKAASTPR